MVTKNNYTSMANAIRFLTIDAVQKANSGHPGLPMGMADVATILFSKHLRFDPQNPKWPNRDRFVLSAGHGSMLLYSILYLLGYEDIDISEIKNFRQLGSKTAGHPEYGHAAGIETTTGPLGQGIANAVGMAIAERILNAEFGDDIIKNRTYCLVGDGCLMEGISQEAITLAGHLKLSQLVVLWDNNNISIDGPISLSDSTDQIARFKSSGWNTIDIDGHSAQAIDRALNEAYDSQLPTFIACRTTIGYGSPNKAGTAASHGAPLGDTEAQLTRKALCWEHTAFKIPSDILDSWRVAGLRSSPEQKLWKKNLDNLDPGIRDTFKQRINGELPCDLNTEIILLKQKLEEEKLEIATRNSSQMVLEVVNGLLPETVGGSADLTGSNNTKTSKIKSISRNNYSGRYIHYGVREHSMAAIMNGMALYGGVIPYSGGFLVFSDYCRPAIRLAALMGVRVIHVLTHDSIGLGEDGPTHQPVEHLAALRAIPNLLLFRPADTVEVAECWQIALETKGSPSVIALTRQKVSQVREAFYKNNLCSRGAYEISPANMDAQVSLFATGSEVEIAIAAKKLLELEGIGTRVVSIPCFELFANQTVEYRMSILSETPVRVGIEAAISQGWEKIIGDNGVFIGMSGFGASAPGDTLYEYFKITPEAVVSAVKSKL